MFYQRLEKWNAGYRNYMLPPSAKMEKVLLFHSEVQAITGNRYCMDPNIKVCMVNKVKQIFIDALKLYFKIKVKLLLCSPYQRVVCSWLERKIESSYNKSVINCYPFSHRILAFMKTRNKWICSERELNWGGLGFLLLFLIIPSIRQLAVLMLFYSFVHFPESIGAESIKQFTLLNMEHR